MIPQALEWLKPRWPQVTVNLSGNHKHKLAVVVTSVLLTVFLTCWALKFLILETYLLPYARVILEFAFNDSERSLADREMLVEQAWRLHQFESRFSQQYYCHDKPIQKDVAWLTVLVNDKYIVPALVLGHSLQQFSCQRNMLAFVSKEVTGPARLALRAVGWTVHEVTQMDCRWMELKQGQAFSGKGILGTHTRLHAWNFTQYSKIVYVDPDVMPVSHMDELFKLPGDFAAAYCARPGIMDPCFNAGLLVFRPDTAHYREIMDFWFKASQDHCINDQVLLWHYYTDTKRWLPLPYAYNVRKIVSHPMKAFHFSWPVPKPWDCPCRPSRKEAKAFDRPLLTLQDVSILFWKQMYEALRRYGLDEWWRGSSFYDSSQEFGETGFHDCWVENGLPVDNAFLYQPKQTYM